MRTIAVHSYKGGTGRTMIVTQLAIALARMRQSVLVVDLDVAAPGLLQRFQAHFNFGIPSVGLVQHATEFETSGVMSELRPFIVNVTPTVGILSPGNPFEPQVYWEKLVRLDSFERNDAAVYFERLKEQIEAEIKPDYVVLDTPSGFSRLVGFCNYLLADVVCCLSTFERDSLQGTNMIARQNERVRQSGHPLPTTHYVLTRFPEYYEGERSLVRVDAAGLSGAIEDARAAIISRLRRPALVGRLSTVRSEPRLQMGGGVMPIPLRGASLRSGIVHDYCALFGELIPTMAGRFDTLKADVPVVRSYYLLEDAGMMINPADDSWNVAFRVDTLLGFVDSLVESAGASQKLVDGALERAGYAAAGNFSEYLAKAWSGDSGGGKGAVSRRLDEWCGFDSRVGFGKFEARLFGKSQGAVVVRNNFLIAGRNRKDLNLCGFMVGYITRILEVLFPGRKVVVTHDIRRDCGQFLRTSGASSCKFSFVAEAKKRGGRMKKKELNGKGNASGGQRNMATQ